MKILKLIALLCLCLSALPAQEANPLPNPALNPAVNKETISLQMLSFVVPEYINSDIITGFFGVGEPALLVYGMRLSPLLGYAYTGDWLKLGIGLPLCGLMAYGAHATRNEPTQAFAKIYWGILSYSNKFDFRKSAFVHFYDNLLLQCIYFITRNDIKFTDGGLFVFDGASFSVGFDL